MWCSGSNQCKGDVVDELRRQNTSNFLKQNTILIELPHRARLRGICSMCELNDCFWNSKAYLMKPFPREFLFKVFPTVEDFFTSDVVSLIYDNWCFTIRNEFNSRVVCWRYKLLVRTIGISMAPTKINWNPLMPAMIRLTRLIYLPGVQACACVQTGEETFVL